jgi:hypothetical protein
MARYLDADGVSGEKRPRGRRIQQQQVSEGADMIDQKPNRLFRKVGQIGLAIVAALAVVIGLASPAYANFPHFKTVSVSLDGSSATGSSLASVASAAAPTSSSVNLPDLLFTWTEVGLGTPDVTYTLKTDVIITFGCVNGGGKNPSASNKITVTTPVGATATKTADKNGQITGSVVLDTGLVSAPAGFSCPSGQTLVALSAKFTDNTITDTTNGVTATDGDISVILGP